MAHREPVVSVLLPVFDPRGDPVDRLRVWTDGQICPRERYQIRLATSRIEPEEEARLRALLAPQDRLVHADVSDGGIAFHVDAASFRPRRGDTAEPVEQWLLLVCPKLPRSGSQAKPRRLGLAVHSISVEPYRPTRSLA